MPELRFQVESAQRKASSFLALSLRLQIDNGRVTEQVHSIALSVQLQIEPARRRYSDVEKRALSDVFAEPARWSTTVRPLFWATINANVPAFTGATHYELTVPPPEPGVAADRYLHAIAEGEIPVILLFSGRVLYWDGSSLQMAPIPWSQEASYRIPVQVCRHFSGEHQYVQRGTPWT